LLSTRHASADGEYIRLSNITRTFSLGLSEMQVNQFTHTLGKIRIDTAFGEFHMALACTRSGHNEQGATTIALVLVLVARFASGLT
jgi:hypothetical protein